MSLFKDIVWWKYERASWQWDILCILIVFFIFLTPKAWFDKKEKLATQTSRLIVKADGFPSDPAERLKRARELSGNPGAEIIELREKTDTGGQKYYEIDIR
jgi:hypothetical protein